MKIPWKWIAAALVGALAVMAVLAAPIADLIASLDSLLPRWGAAGLVLYALIYALAPLLLLPTLPFSFGGGLMFGLWRGLAAVMLGSVLTATAGFLLSRHFLRHLIEPKIRADRRFAAIDRTIARDGWKIVGPLRLTWLHCGFSNYAYGVTAIPFRQYILISAITLIPGNVISVYLGAAGVIGYEVLAGAERTHDRRIHPLGHWRRREHHRRRADVRQSETSRRTGGGTIDAPRVTRSATGTARPFQQ